MIVIRQGRWLPPILARTDTRIIIGVMAYVALVRALDYLTGDDSRSPTSTLGTIESAAPIWFWGMCMLASAATLLVGMAGRWTWAVIGAHFVLSALYGGLAVGLIAEIVATRPFLDGIRSAAGLIVPAVIHYVCGSRSNVERVRADGRLGGDAGIS